MDLPPAVRAVLEEQHGLATVAQLLAGGMTREAVRWRVNRGWRMVLPRVVSTAGPVEGDRRLIAGLLYAGPEAMVSGLCAAAWHGVTAARLEGPVQVNVPVSRHPRGHGFVTVTRTTRPDPRPWRRGPLTVVSRARAVVDAACSRTAGGQARAIVLEAVQRRLVRAEDLRHELESGPRHRSGTVRQAVDEAERRAWSVPEADLTRLLTRSSLLPAALANPRLTAADGTRLPTPDLWFDDVGLAVQVHSWQFHGEPDDWDATVMTDGVFAGYGISLVGVTPRAVSRRPDLVLQRVEAAYRAAADRPRPEVRAQPS
jgi:hypothetical protein